VSAFLAVLPSLALVVLLAAVGVLQFRETRRGRRDADPPAPVTEPPPPLPPPLARHPARRRGVPGLPVDGEPLSEEDLAEYTAIMMRPTTRDQGRRPR
jgi:hypothetical protein